MFINWNCSKKEPPKMPIKERLLILFVGAIFTGVIIISFITGYYFILIVLFLITMALASTDNDVSGCG